MTERSIFVGQLPPLRSFRRTAGEAAGGDLIDEEIDDVKILRLEPGRTSSAGECRASA